MELVVRPLRIRDLPEQFRRRTEFDSLPRRKILQPVQRILRRPPRPTPLRRRFVTGHFDVDVHLAPRRELPHEFANRRLQALPLFRQPDVRSSVFPIHRTHLNRERESSMAEVARP